MLRSIPFYFRNGTDLPDIRLQIFQHFFQFAVRLLFRRHGNQQGRSVAKIVASNQGKHPGWQLHFHFFQSMPQLRPKLVGIPHIVVQFHKNRHHALAGTGLGLFFVDFFVTENVVLNGCCQLFFHLKRSSARVNSHNNSFPDGKLRVFAAGHIF